jgi:YidC/Oxa1 family membrane protein insertase
MDIRRILLFVALSGLILLGWNRFMLQPLLKHQRLGAERQAAQAEIDRKQKLADKEAARAPVEAPRPGQQPAAIADNAEPPSELPRHEEIDDIYLGSLDPDSGYFMRVALTTRGASVRQIELNGHEDLENGGAPLRVISTITDGQGRDRRSYRTFQTAVPAIDDRLGRESTALSDVNWELVEPRRLPEAGGPPLSSATFRYALPGAPLEILKTYSLVRLDPQKVDLAEAREESETGYELRMALTLRNTSGQQQQVSYEFVGPVGLPLENLDYARKFSDFKIGMIDDGSVDLDTLSVGEIAENVDEILEKAEARGRKLTVAEASRQLQDWQQAFRFAGIDVQFFAGFVAPPPGQKWIAKVQPLLLQRDPEATHSSISALFTSDEFELAPDGELVHEYRLFAGPKQQDLLAAYQAGEIVEFGWFAPLSKAMLWLLNVFHDGLGLPYAIAIVCLTIVVRGAMFPLSKKQALGAAKMKELQPQIAELKKKYGDDKQKLTQAQMELFRKANYNPLAGCLPIFLQLPIFIGLYNGLYCSVELRNASFLWIDNLAAPDALFPFPWGKTWFLGPYFNLLPILTVALFIIQQKMFMPPPAADDEQAKMMYRTMNIMMVVMGFLFYGVPAGLCVYFIASSLWGIGERKLLERMKPAERPPEAPPKPPGSRPGSPVPAGPNGDAPKGFWARLIEMAEASQSHRNEQKAAAGKDPGAKASPGGAGPKKRGKSKRR